MQLVKKNALVLFSLFALIAFPSPGMGKTWKQICENEPLNFDKLMTLDKHIKTLEGKTGAPASEVESLLGAPVRKSDPAVGQEEAWVYPHPCYGNVRFLVFFKDGKLEKIQSVINVNGNDVFYRPARFLPKKGDGF